MTTTTDFAVLAEGMSNAAWALNQSDPGDRAAKERYSKAYVALMEARPTAPTDLALQLRWLIGHAEEHPDARLYIATLDQIADQLEVLVEPRVASVEGWAKIPRPKVPMLLGTPRAMITWAGVFCWVTVMVFTLPQPLPPAILALGPALTLVCSLIALRFRRRDQ